MALDPFSVYRRYESIPPMPPQYQPRPDVEAEHRAMLLRARGAVALTASFDGPAGVGKTTLAKVMCHDREVRAHFADGIHWLAFGRERAGFEVLQTLATTLSAGSSASSGASLCSEISTRVADRRLLLVLDDVWEAEQVVPFAEISAGGNGRLALLLTTRNAQLASTFGESMHLEHLSDDASLRMLNNFIGSSSHGALKADAYESEMLLRSCRGNVAMLRSVAGLCRKRGVSGAVRYLEEIQLRQQTASLPDVCASGARPLDLGVLTLLPAPCSDRHLQVAQRSAHRVSPSQHKHFFLAMNLHVPPSHIESHRRRRSSTAHSMRRSRGRWPN